MIIVLKQGVPEARVDELKKWIESQGLVVSPIYGSEKTVLGLVGDTSCLSTDEVSMYEAVEKVLKVQEPFKRLTASFIPKIPLSKWEMFWLAEGNWWSSQGHARWKARIRSPRLLCRLREPVLPCSEAVPSSQEPPHMLSRAFGQKGSCC